MLPEDRGRRHAWPGGGERLASAAAGQQGGVFLFFSNRLGCLGSIVLSVVITLVLVALLRGF
jgi:hypothetical protein